MVYICRLCHAENKPTAKFCRRCGVARPPEAELPAGTQPETAPALMQATESAPVPVATPEPEQTPAPAPARDRAVELDVCVDKTVKKKPAQVARQQKEQRQTAGWAASQQDGNELPVEEITEEEVISELKGERLPAEVSGKSPLLRTESAEQAEAVSGATDDSRGSAPASEVRRGGPACSSCGTTIRAQDKFCIWCGARQPDRAPPEVKHCPACRTQLPLKANYCYVCGADVSPHQRRKIRVPVELFQEEDPDLFPAFRA